MASAEELSAAFPQWTAPEIQTLMSGMPEPIDTDRLLALLSDRRPTDAQLAQFLNDNEQQRTQHQYLYPSLSPRLPSYQQVSQTRESTPCVPAAILPVVETDARPEPRRRRTRSPLSTPLLQDE